MKRETEYYAEFFNQDFEIVTSFSVSAHNPKQAMNRAFDKVDNFDQIERVVIRFGIDIKAEWNLSQYKPATPYTI